MTPGDLSAIGAVGAVVVAAAALILSIESTRASVRSAAAAERAAQAAERAAKAAEDQANIQGQLRIDAAQPYVWADVRPDDGSGVILVLIIGNSGLTVAQHVQVKIDPPFPNIPQLAEAVAAQQRLAEGFKSLPPGRTLRWWLGQGWNLLQPEGTQPHQITINAEGPFGPIPELTYELDLSEYRGQDPQPQGNLHLLTKAVEKLADKR